MQAWSYADPASALQFAQSLPDDSKKNDYISLAVMGWAGADPVGAINMLAQLPPEILDSNPNFYSRLAEGLVKQDVATAREWAVSQPEGKPRDMAIEGFVMGTRNDPPGEFQLALTVQDADTQVYLLSTTYPNWYAKDPSAAAKALEEANLAENVKANLRNSGAQAARKAQGVKN